MLIFVILSMSDPSPAILLTLKFPFKTTPLSFLEHSQWNQQTPTILAASPNINLTETGLLVRNLPQLSQVEIVKLSRK